MNDVWHLRFPILRFTFSPWSILKLLYVCLAAHAVEFHGWTSGYVKLLLPPRQSRGVSFRTRPGEVAVLARLVLLCH